MPDHELVPRLVGLHTFKVSLRLVASLEVLTLCYDPIRPTSRPSVIPIFLPRLDLLDPPALVHHGPESAPGTIQLVQQPVRTLLFLRLHDRFTTINPTVQSQNAIQPRRSGDTASHLRKNQPIPESY